MRQHICVLHSRVLRVNSKCGHLFQGLPNWLASLCSGWRAAQDLMPQHLS